MINASLKLKSGAVLKNRIVKSAMSEALADENNDASDALIRVYAQWGVGGAGLLITGNALVDRRHLEHAGNFVLDQDSDRQQTRKFAAAAKSGGALVLAQINHPGRQQTTEDIGARPLSISDVRLDLPGYAVPVAATEQDLREVIEKFACSATLAREAGFDGVEIHSAHGYLLSSSLSKKINTRTDRWGGSLQNRARLLLSVVRAVRGALGDDFIIATKLNSADFQKGGFSHEDSIAVAKMLQREGIDFIEISGGNFETPMAYRHASKSSSTVLREAYFLDYARAVKAALQIPVMVTGGFRSREIMDAALAEGAVDLIGMGRPFIIDPQFPAKLLAGRIDTAPAVERDFPPAEELPPGAALNWFCHQLALRGKHGDIAPAVSVVDAHERYLQGIRAMARRLREVRAVRAVTAAKV